jgi:hypothetical protein
VPQKGLETALMTDSHFFQVSDFSVRMAEKKPVPKPVLGSYRPYQTGIPEILKSLLGLDFRDRGGAARFRAKQEYISCDNGRFKQVVIEND